MKKNCKGFMLAETLIVATFISAILVYLFIQFRNISSNYDKTSRYNGVNEIYLLNEVKKYLDTQNFNDLSYSIGNEVNYYVLSDCDSNFFTDSNYCNNLFSFAGIKKAIYFDSENVVQSEELSNQFNDFLRTIDNEKSIYVIAAEFNDGSFASLKTNGTLINTLEYVIKQQPIYVDHNLGSGLYFDNSIPDDPIYVYKGVDNNSLSNNINIFGYDGKIIFLDDVGVKIYFDLKENVIFDSESSFFTSYALLDSGNYDSTSNYNSALFANLNNIKITSDNILNNVKYGVGRIDQVINSNLASIIESENTVYYKASNVNNFISSLNVSDIIRTSLSCDVSNITNDCLINNWLNNNVWTINYSDSFKVWTINNNTFESVSVGKNSLMNAYSVIYLDKNAKVIGNGTKEYPFKLK